MAAPPTVKSSVSSTFTDTRDVTRFHSQKPTMGVVCLCIVFCCQWRAVVGCTDRQIDRQTDRQRGDELL